MNNISKKIIIEYTPPLLHDECPTSVLSRHKKGAINIAPFL